MRCVDQAWLPATKIFFSGQAGQCLDSVLWSKHHEQILWPCMCNRRVRLAGIFMYRLLVGPEKYLFPPIYSDYSPDTLRNGTKSAHSTGWRKVRVFRQQIPLIDYAFFIPVSNGISKALLESRSSASCTTLRNNTSSFCYIISRSSCSWIPVWLASWILDKNRNRDCRIMEL